MKLLEKLSKNVSLLLLQLNSRLPFVAAASVRGAACSRGPTGRCAQMQGGRAVCKARMFSTLPSVGVSQSPSIRGWW